MALSLYRVAPGAPCNLRAAELPHCLGGNFCHIWHSNSNSCWRMSSTVCQKKPEGLYASKTEWDLLVPVCTNCYTKCWVCSLHSGGHRMVPSYWVMCTSSLSPDQQNGLLQRCGLPVSPAMWSGDMGDKSTGNQALLALYFWNSMLPVYLRPLHSRRCMGKETGILFPDIPYLSAFLLFCYS